MKDSHMLRRYTFKLYPNAAQAAALTEQARMCASLWNALLEMREAFYRRAKQRGDKKTSLSAFDQGKDITELRQQCPEWAAMPRGTQERVAGDLDLAMKAFFRRAKAGAGGASGYPRFKSVRRAESIPLREPAKSCWTLTAHSAPAGDSEPRGAHGASRARREEGARVGKDEAAARGETIRPVSWRFSLRGVPGRIKTRGRFPASPEALKTADVKFHAGAWWLSVCVEIAARIKPGTERLTVAFDLIDGFASVTDADGRCAPGLSDPFHAGGKGEFSTSDRGFSTGPCGEPLIEGEVQEAGPSDNSPALQSQRDSRFRKFSYRWRKETARIAKLKASMARQRHYALHVWSTRLVASAADLTVIAPPIKDNTRTGRGSKAAHGAQVETIAAFNKSILEKAPAKAVAMLTYKAAEAGIRCDVVKAEDHQIAIGRDLRAAAVAAKRARRALKRAERKAA
jgi:putative transposase